MSQRVRKKRLGKQPPRFRFFLNPYTDVRFTSCPKCDGKTKQRKLPLVIHIGDAAEPRVMNLNKTCRYCPNCDLLIAHKDQIEPFIAQYYDYFGLDGDPTDFLVLGTLDRADWAQGVKQQLTTGNLREILHDFKDYWDFEPAPRWAPAE